MDLSAGKIMDTVESHATALTFLLTSYARTAEGAPADPLGDLVKYFTFQMPTTPLTELTQDFSSFAALKWKLWDSPHANTGIFKMAAIVWALGKFVDVIPAKYVNLAGKVATGAAASALLLPGSGPAGNSQVATMAQQTGSYTNSPLQGSTLNQSGMQRLANYQTVYGNGNPTSGSFYTAASGARLAGN